MGQIGRRGAEDSGSDRRGRKTARRGRIVGDLDAVREVLDVPQLLRPVRGWAFGVWGLGFGFRVQGLTRSRFGI